MGVFSELEKAFKSKDLYIILKIERNSSSSEIKKAYYKLSLQIHPDKVENADIKNATHKFQLLNKIYAVLSNGTSRQIYDETGSINEDDSVLTETEDWIGYWRLIFPQLNVGDISKFEAGYRGSEEEKNDLISLYVKFKGNLKKIMDNLLCSSINDENRYREVVESVIVEGGGGVERYECFFDEPLKKKQKRIRKAKQEEKEAEEMLKILIPESSSNGGETSLEMLIKKNHRTRLSQANNFLSNLEEKYSAKQPPKKKSKKN